MVGRKLTLFEIHLDDATFTATNADGAVPAGDEEADEPTDDEAGGCRAKRAGRALLVLALLGLSAAAAAKALGGEVDEELEELAELDAE